MPHRPHSGAFLGVGKPLSLRRGTQQPALLAMLSASSRASGMELACPLMGNPYWKSQALALGSTLARAGPEIQVPKLTASSLRALETLPNHLRPHQMPTLLALWMHRTPHRSSKRVSSPRKPGPRHPLQRLRSSRTSKT